MYCMRVAWRAGRDVRRWLDRREELHAAFSTGPHRCLGEWLGRQGMRVGIERLWRPDLCLEAGREVELSSSGVRVARSLWVNPSGAGG
jgi:hypothetical protein